MNKPIVLFIIDVLLLSLSGGCKKIVAETQSPQVYDLPAQTTIPQIADDTSDSVQQPEDPEEKHEQESEAEDDLQPKKSDWEALTPEEKEVLDKFRNEPKEPWGEKDISIYSIYGDVLKTPYISSDPEKNLLTRGASLVEYYKSVSYRGVIIGENAIDALKRIEVPKQAIYHHNYNYGSLEEYEGYDKSYDFKEVCEWIELMKDTTCTLFIGFFFNENFDLLQVECLEDGMTIYHCMISVHQERVIDYSTGTIRYSNIIPNNKIT